MTTNNQEELLSLTNKTRIFQEEELEYKSSIIASGLPVLEIESSSVIIASSLPNIED